MAIGHNKSWVASGCNRFLGGPKVQTNIFCCSKRPANGWNFLNDLGVKRLRVTKFQIYHCVQGTLLPLWWIFNPFSLTEKELLCPKVAPNKFWTTYGNSKDIYGPLGPLEIFGRPKVVFPNREGWKFVKMSILQGIWMWYFVISCSKFVTLSNTNKEFEYRLVVECNCSVIK